MAQMLRIHGWGLDKLQLDNVAARPLRENEARIKVGAFGITGDNLNYINGNLLPGQKAPALPAGFGYEAAGTVTEVGPGVDQSWLKKRVAPIGPYDFNKYSSAGSEIIVPADRLWEIPVQMTDEQAAALWVPYLTAFPVTHVRQGNYALITAVSSTVGHAAAEYAHAKGAKVIGTTRSEKKKRQLQREGLVDAVILVKPSQPFIKQVMSLTANHGVDFIFDPIAGQQLNELLTVCAPGAQIVEYGVLAGMQASINIGQLMSKKLTLRGYVVAQLTSQQEALKAAVAEVESLIKAHQINPLIDAVFPLSQYQQAFAELQNKDHWGRVIIAPQQ